MGDALRVGLYRVLAILGFFLVLFLQAPLSVATLSLIEPFLIAILTAAWFTSYYLGATLGRRYGVEESTPIFHRFLPGHILVADGLKFSRCEQCSHVQNNEHMFRKMNITLGQ